MPRKSSCCVNRGDKTTKKIVSILLALLLCLTLFACGSSQNKDELQQQTEAEAAENIGTDHPLLPYLYGEWKQEVYEGIKCSFNTIVINDNRTCVIDGMNATWEIDLNNTRHDTLWVYFYDGSNKLGGVVFSESSFNKEGYSFSTLEPEGWMSSAIWAKKS